MTKESLLVKVTEANHIKDYQIELTFSDGLKGIVDLKDEIWGEVFEPLKDVEYFASFTKDRWTIGWDCGADFAPEFLYGLINAKSKSVDTLA
jgi:hypothetical protein